MNTRDSVGFYGSLYRTLSKTHARKCFVSYGYTVYVALESYCMYARNFSAANRLNIYVSAKIIFDNICKSACSAAWRIKLVYMMLLYDVRRVTSVYSHFLREIINGGKQQIDSYGEVG